MSDVPRVTGVEVLGHYQLRLRFDDGKVRDVDLGHLRTGGPIFEPLRDPEYFSQVAVDTEAGTVAWPNGVDLDPIVLYGDIDAAGRQQIA